MNFPSTAAKWIHQSDGVVLHVIGDGLEIAQCLAITNYTLILNRTINTTCYHDFPVLQPHQTEVQFLHIYDRQVVHLSPQIACTDRPSHTYLKDQHNDYFLILGNGTTIQVDPKADVPSHTMRLHLQPIRGYDERLLAKPPHVLEPYAMLTSFSYVHDALNEVKNLQVQQGGGNVLVGIGKALGATIQSTAKGASSIIKSVGAAIHDTLDGVGDLDEKIVTSLGHAASDVISSTGGALKDAGSGLGNVFHGIFGGIGGTIKWALLLLILVYIGYVNRSRLSAFCRKKHAHDEADSPQLPLMQPAVPITPMVGHAKDNRLTRLPQNKPAADSPQSPLKQPALPMTPIVGTTKRSRQARLSQTKTGTVHSTTADRKPKGTICTVSRPLNDTTKLGLQATGRVTCEAKVLELQTMIDTGSTCSLIHEEVWRIIAPDALTDNTPLLATTLLSVTGEKFTVSETPPVQVSLADEDVTTTLYVSRDIHHDVVFGMDLLSAMKVTIDLDAWVLRTTQNQIPLQPVSDVSSRKYQRENLYKCCHVVYTKKTWRLFLPILMVLLILFTAATFTAHRFHCKRSDIQSPDTPLVMHNQSYAQ